MMALDEAHLRRLIRANTWPIIMKTVFTTLLNKDTPNRRAIQAKPSPAHGVISMPRLGGLHHRYAWQDAA